MRRFGGTSTSPLKGFPHSLQCLHLGRADNLRPEQISLSYNGGKDCLVLTLLILAGLPQHFASTSKATSDAKAPNGTDDATPFPESLRAVYIVPPHPFPEVAEFVSSSSAEYHLSIAKYNAPMRSALDAYKADNPSIQAVFVGTVRTTDVCSSLMAYTS